MWSEETVEVKQFTNFDTSCFESRGSPSGRGELFFSGFLKRVLACFYAAQRGQQWPGLVCGGDGDVHQSGPHRGHVCGWPGETRPGPGNDQRLMKSEKYISKQKRHNNTTKHSDRIKDFWRCSSKDVWLPKGNSHWIHITACGEPPSVFSSLSSSLSQPSRSSCATTNAAAFPSRVNSVFCQQD